MEKIMPDPKSQHRATSASGVPLTADQEPENTPLTKKQCGLFLNELSTSGDIIAAAAAAGRDEADFFIHRQASVGFRAEWDAAFEIVYLRIESACVAAVIRVVTRPAKEIEPRLLAIYHRLALSLLAARRTLTGVTRRAASAVQHASGINDKAALLQKLTAMQRKKQNEIAKLANNG
jgi:hypothetical protein